ncbi:AMP-binding protein [Sanyastnella coralliicola]|uniref:AMP-binding protein n=1 Tax=Sanyastnella coralliicola TaxID=3069118 RepID=UPI0027BA3B5E|nr:AMP-binding protein [Longitalea sp. SCSIO 12813]
MVKLIFHNQRINPLTEDLSGDDNFVNEINAALQDWRDQKKLEISTSGSTGQPKVITHSLEAVKESIRMTRSFFQIEEGAEVLLCLPISKIAGRMMLYRALDSGWNVHVTAPSSNPLAGINTSFDFVAMTPMQVECSLEEPAFHNMKTLIIGGAPASDQLIEALQKTPVRAFETYGMTETITHIAARQLSPEFSTSFRALPGVRFRASENNTLIIDTPHVGTIETTDVIKLHDEHRFIWLGRADNIINTGGIKLQPEVIEEKLRALITERFYVIGRPDATLGSAVTLVIEASSRNVDDLLGQMKAVLDRFEVPKNVEFSPQFEETITGKVIRK